jgi:hypothetical protein
VVPHPQHAPTTLSILLQVECPSQMERVYEWSSSLVGMFGGFASYIYANRASRYPAAALTYGLCFGNGGWDLVKDGWDEDEWIGTVGRHSCI